MEINNIKVTIMDFERLDDIITRTLKLIKLGYIESAEHMLGVLQGSIKSNLIAESNSKQDICIGDDVEITYLGSGFDEQAKKYLGAQCYVDDVTISGEYMLQAKNYNDRNVDNYIFAKEHLTLI